jgi:hypothetical protein
MFAINWGYTPGSQNHSLGIKWVVDDDGWVEINLGPVLYYEGKVTLCNVTGTYSVQYGRMEKQKQSCNGHLCTELCSISNAKR